jgi:hypothetical protein
MGLLRAWDERSDTLNWLYVAICVGLTLMSGLMSGLTLGLLSLDSVVRRYS